MQLKNILIGAALGLILRKSFDAYVLDGFTTPALGKVKVKDLVNTPACFTVWLPVSKVFTDEKTFQNRDDAHSGESVAKILKAVENGLFDWGYFDPITVWQNDTDGKYYVLSGHSRTAAFKILKGKKADDNDFYNIPAKIFKGTKQAAIQYALNSNVLATPEKETERAKYYRFRLEKGENPRSIREDIRDNEAANSSRIWAYAQLNPQGKTMNALRALERAEATSSENIKIVAKWIGDALTAEPELSNLHENEIYEYLVTGAKYGKIYRRYAEFLEDLERLIAKRKAVQKFAKNLPLNLQDLEFKSPVKMTYDRQVLEQQAKVKEVQRESGHLERRLLAERPELRQFINAVLPFEEKRLAEKYKLFALLDKKQSVLDYTNTQEKGLFGISFQYL